MPSYMTSILSWLLAANMKDSNYSMVEIGGKPGFCRVPSLRSRQGLQRERDEDGRMDGQSEETADRVRERESG